MFFILNTHKHRHTVGNLWNKEIYKGEIKISLFESSFFKN